jgi:protein-S-isoprenylcysteine O-methyltransferase Ste14
MFLSRDSLTISSETGKLSGSIIFFLGMAVFLWTSLFLCEAFQGIVTPVTDRLIVIGPYRWIRHPLYLSMIIILLGMGISLRSLW